MASELRSRRVRDHRGSRDTRPADGADRSDPGILNGRARRHARSCRLSLWRARSALADRRGSPAVAVAGIARDRSSSPGTGFVRRSRALFRQDPAAANWNLPWHQDLTIAVRARCEVPGFGPWTLKAGIPHVHAPADLLAQMVTIRLHLDDCRLENGPLRVLPGSHAEGKLDAGATLARGRAPVSLQSTASSLPQELS